MSLLLPMMIAGLLVTGMGLALLGSVKVALAERLQIDEARVGGLVSMFGFAMIPVILTTGFLTDQIDKQMLLAGGSVLMVVSLVVLALARSYWVGLLAVLLLSASWSAQINVLNVLTPLVFKFSEESTEAFAFNLANFVFGLGAFLTPLAAVFLLKRGGLRTTLFVIGGVVLATSVFNFAANFDDLQLPTGKAVAITVLLGDPLMWLCALALFFYGPLEAAVAAWATTYLGDQKVSEGAASSALSGFWLTFMIARLTTAFTLPPGYEAQLILGLGITSVAVLSGFVWSRSSQSAIAMVLAAGLIFGPIFPTIMAVLLGHFEPAVHGRAVGLLFAIGGIGWTTIPMLIGAYARKTSVQRGFVIAIGSASGLCVIALLLLLHLT